MLEALHRLFEGNIPNNAWDRPYTGVRTDRYTYVVWSETGEKELYDRKLDPHELESVAGDPGYADSPGGPCAEAGASSTDCKGRACRVPPVRRSPR